MRPTSALWLLPLAFLWWRLIDHLRVEWTLNPQYGYGWAVPVLCAYLIWQRFPLSDSSPPLSALRSPLSVLRPPFSFPNFRVSELSRYLSDATECSRSTVSARARKKDKQTRNGRPVGIPCLIKYDSWFCWKEFPANDQGRQLARRRRAKS